MEKGMKRLLIGSAVTAGALGAAGVAYGAATHYLVKVALDRQLPKHTAGAERRLAGECFDGKFLQVLRQKGRQLKEKGGETVRIAGRDGVELVGHWFAHPQPRRIIVAMHGWRSSWCNDFGTVADFWFDNGCSVLFAEQRGQGESGGDHMSFGLLERHDCLSWVNWVTVREKTLPVYLCGVSMGASTVLMAAGLDLPDRVKGIIADCGYTSPEAIWRHVAKENLRLSYGLHGLAARDLCRRKLQVAIDDYSCVDAMAECQVPVLFVHGTDDRFVPIEMTYENYKACAGPKRLLVVPGAGHGMSYYLDPKAYQEAFAQFWEDFDGEEQPPVG